MARTHRKSFPIVLLRGGLGGMAAGFIVAFVDVYLMDPRLDNWFGYFLILCIIYYLPFGIVIGFAIGIGIWLIHAETGKALGIPARATLGTLFGTIACAITLYAISSDRRGYVQSSLKSTLLGIFLLGLAFGGIPALFVGHPRDESRVSS